MGILDKILAAIITISLAASIKDIETKEGLADVRGLSWNGLRSCFIFNYKIKLGYHNIVLLSTKLSFLII